MEITTEHPLWDIYDEFRTARLSVRYYERQLSNLRRYNFVIELILALTVSSGVAGLWFWETSLGAITWKILVSIAAILAVVKPLIKLSDQVQQKGEILASWRILDDGFQQFTISVKERKKYDNEMQNRFHELLETKTAIIQREPLEQVNENLRKKSFEQVKQELPSENFFFPED